MSPLVEAFRDRLIRRANALTPDVRTQILKAWDRLTAGLNDTQVAQMVERGQFEAILPRAEIEAELARMRLTLRNGVEEAGRSFANALPGRARGTPPDPTNPKVVEAIRGLNSRVTQTLADDTSETVRAFVENGLRDGTPPKAIARQIRAVVGLAPNQLDAVANFRRMLEEGDATALQRALRDRRFDRTIAKAFAGDGLSQDQIDRMVDRYRERFVAFHAETVARTASMDAQKLAHHLTWSDAIDRGDLDGASLFKTWKGVMDDRERPEHVAMEGETVRWDEHYSNGEMTPGESTYNCRCISLYRTVRDPNTARTTAIGAA